MGQWEKEHFVSSKMFVWLQDEQHLAESNPVTPTNLMSIFPEPIFSLLLNKILCLQYVYCQTFYSPRVAPCYHPTLKVYASSVCSSLYQMEIIKLYTGNRWVEQLAWEVSSLTTAKKKNQGRLQHKNFPRKLRISQSAHENWWYSFVCQVTSLLPGKLRVSQTSQDLQRSC